MDKCKTAAVVFLGTGFYATCISIMAWMVYTAVALTF